MRYALGSGQEVAFKDPIKVTSIISYAMKLDLAIARALALEPSTTSVKAHGGSGFSTTAKIISKLDDGSEKAYFLKMGRGKAAGVMFRGEHASLNALHGVDNTLAPKSHAFGTLEDSSDQYFLVTDFLEMGRSSSSKDQVSPRSLAAKLALLHTTPAPVPAGYSRPMFGFPVTTCCGDTAQPNNYSESWADFYANHRLRAILKKSERTNGSDGELRDLVEKIASKIVPRLLGDGHLNGGNGVTPVVIHGDLWSGNKGVAKIDGADALEEIVFDPSSCYAHSEAELGIMKMFGGFGASFLNEYHKTCPKTEPVAEYEDRVSLYELYHHLNHHAIFGGGYRSGAISIMRKLWSKYGNG